jgi:hypothetical protein
MLFLCVTTVQAKNIQGDYPICTSPQAAQNFDQAQRFNDHQKMEAMIINGECLFVEPDIKGTVLEATVMPKVLVFIPYGKPITGWTRSDNLK